MQRGREKARDQGGLVRSHRSSAAHNNQPYRTLMIAHFWAVLNFNRNLGASLANVPTQHDVPEGARVDVVHDFIPIIQAQASFQVWSVYLSTTHSSLSKPFVAPKMATFAPAPACCFFRLVQRSVQWNHNEKHKETKNPAPVFR